MTLRSFNEPWEPEDVFDRLEAQERRERTEAAIEKNRRMLELEAVQVAELKAKADELTQRANASIAMAEFAARGLQPPFTDGAGAPRVSLGLLLKLGWRIEQVGDRNMLVGPGLR